MCTNIPEMSPVRKPYGNPVQILDRAFWNNAIESIEIPSIICVPLSFLANQNLLYLVPVWHHPVRPPQTRVDLSCSVVLVVRLPDGHRTAWDPLHCLFLRVNELTQPESSVKRHDTEGLTNRCWRRSAPLGLTNLTWVR